MNIDEFVRKNILKLQPYSSARSEFKGNASVWLDANENAFGSPLPEKYNRYPDPLQINLKKKIAAQKGIPYEHICVGNGSDELVDYTVRIFCEPEHDNIIVCPPTFRMYEVAAAVNNNEVIKVLLDPDFQLQTDQILNAVNGHTKIIFICSPNNPTGNSMRHKDIEKIIKNFHGIVVVDEAYIDFAGEPSVFGLLKENRNLIVLQTLSKAWGLAGLRVGFAFADPEIIRLMSAIKMPYNVNASSQKLAMEALEHGDVTKSWKDEILDFRKKLSQDFGHFSFIEKVFPSDANFILVRVKDAAKLYRYLISLGIVIRNQSSQPMLDNCVRITVGTKEENKLLIEALKKFENG